MKLLLVGFTHERARDWARDMELDPSQYVVVTNHVQVEGCRPPFAVVFHKDCHKLADWDAIRNGIIRSIP